LYNEKKINMTNFKWIISAMECIKNEGDLQDVVITIHWRYAAEKDGVSTDMYGATSMPLPTGEDFTPYEELTKEQVCGWLEATLDVPAMEESLDKQLDLIINPINVTLQPPFDN
jgi:hypothetical protein